VPPLVDGGVVLQRHGQGGLRDHLAVGGQGDRLVPRATHRIGSRDHLGVALRGHRLLLEVDRTCRRVDRELAEQHAERLEKVVGDGADERLDGVPLMGRRRVVDPLLDPRVGDRQREVARHFVVGEREPARLGELAVAVVVTVVERQVRGRHQDGPAVGPDELLDVLDQGAAHALPPLGDVHVDDGPGLLGVVEEEGEQDGGADHPLTVVGGEELRPLAAVGRPDRAQELLEVPVRGSAAGRAARSAVRGRRTRASARRP
jgi:hypothetical protein